MKVKNIPVDSVISTEKWFAMIKHLVGLFPTQYSITLVLVQKHDVYC